MKASFQAQKRAVICEVPGCKTRAKALVAKSRDLA